MIIFLFLLFIVVWVPQSNEVYLSSEANHFALIQNTGTDWKKVNKIHDSTKELINYCRYILLDYLGEEIYHVLYAKVTDNFTIHYESSRKGDRTFVPVLQCYYTKGLSPDVTYQGFVKGDEESVYAVVDNENGYYTLGPNIVLNYEQWSQVSPMNYNERINFCKIIASKPRLRMSEEIIDARLQIVKIKQSPSMNSFRKVALACYTSEGDEPVRFINSIIPRCDPSTGYTVQRLTKISRKSGPFKPSNPINIPNFLK